MFHAIWEFAQSADRDTQSEDRQIGSQSADCYTCTMLPSTWSAKQLVHIIVLVGDPTWSAKQLVFLHHTIVLVGDPTWSAKQLVFLHHTLVLVGDPT